MRSKLTKAAIEQALKGGVPAGKAHLMLWDDLPGLGLKVRHSGSASWVFVYRPIGAGAREPSRTLTLGQWPALDIAGARAAAATNAGRRAQGGDPAKEAASRKRRERWTVGAAADAYEADLKRREFVNLKTRMSSLRTGLAKHLNKELAALTRADVMEALAEREGRGLTSDDLRKAVNGMLNFMIERGRIQFNVLAGVKRPRATRAEQLDRVEKGRALTDDEIVRVWRACDGMGSFGNLIRMALLTGCRKNELAKLPWDHVTDEAIVIAAKVAKQARQHVIPLTPAMRRIIAEQRALRGTAGAKSLVFPSVDGPNVVISGWTKLMTKLRARAGFAQKREEGDWFTPHDARRTARTLMSKCGVADDLAEIAIGHLTAGLIRTYNKDQREQARLDAFTKVSTYISRLVEDEGEPAAAGNVVVLSSQVGRR